METLPYASYNFSKLSFHRTNPVVFIANSFSNLCTIYLHSDTQRKDNKYCALIKCQHQLILSIVSSNYDHPLQGFGGQVPICRLIIGRERRKTRDNLPVHRTGQNTMHEHTKGNLERSFNLIVISLDGRNPCYPRGEPSMHKENMQTPKPGF